MTTVVAAIHGLILFFMAYFVWGKQDKSIRFFFWPALLVKVIAGVLLGLMYQYYYSGGDTFIFFREAKQLSELFRTDVVAYFRLLWNDESQEMWSGLSRSLFFTKVVSVINVLTLDNYWITSIYFSFISFLGSWYLVKKILSLFPDAKFASAVSILFFPTVFFWSSGLVKESLAMASLFFLSGFFLGLINKTKSSIAEWVLLLTSLWVLWTLKYYWAIVFFPTTVTTFIFYRIVIPRLDTKQFGTQLMIWFGLFLVLCFGAMFAHPNFYPEYFLQVVIDNNTAFNSLSESDNLIHYSNLQPTWTSIILNSPWALFSGLLRPFFWEADSALKILYSLENLVILILIVSSLKNLSKVVSSPYNFIVFAVLVYVVVLCVFLSFSTPNFGTLARYRMGFLPFLIFILAYMNPLLEKLSVKLKRD